MRTLVLNPPFLPKFSRNQRSPSVTKSGTLYFPIWLAYATGLLESQGHECKLVDAPADDLDLDKVLDLVREYKPGLIALDTSTPSSTRSNISTNQNHTIKAIPAARDFSLTSTLIT